MTAIFAVTTRGLETICADEMAQVAGLHVRATHYRRITADYTGPLAQLLQLRTVDDLFLDLGEWHAIGPERTVLAQFRQLSEQLDLWHALSLREQIQPLPDVPTFSVSANFVGKRNYSSEEIKEQIAAGIGEVYGWTYSDNDATSHLNLRLFIEHETAYVGMRLGNAPLHRRAYKQQSVRGSLKSTVAAAMLRLAHVTPGMQLLDPYCGAGTILIEAAQMGATALGGDNDPAAVDITRANARAAQTTLDVRHWDARRLPLDARTVDRIVTNLPWGRQVAVDAALADFYRKTCAEIQRVLADDGRAVLLTNVPESVYLPALACEQRIEVSLFGQTPTILVFGRSTEDNAENATASPDEASPAE